MATSFFDSGLGVVVARETVALEGWVQFPQLTPLLTIRCCSHKGLPSLHQPDDPLRPRILGTLEGEVATKAMVEARQTSPALRPQTGAVAIPVTFAGLR